MLINGNKTSAAEFFSQTSEIDPLDVYACKAWILFFFFFQMQIKNQESFIYLEKMTYLLSNLDVLYDG